MVERQRSSATQGNAGTPRVTPEYVRPADVVTITGLSRSAVFAALWAGKLAGHRVGRAWLIPRSAVDDWIRGHDQAA